jgi:murein DD-endopeptidase MepM/ murein hydrolase activator NlpD
VRIVLAIVSVAVLGAIAVAASAPPAPPAENASLAHPRYTPIPETSPSFALDVGDRRARSDGRLYGRFIVPIEGAEPPDDPDLLPGAPRDYRAGVHEGIDFPADTGTPVLAAADGTVIRIDTSFLDWTREQQEIALFEAVQLGYTPAATLDRVRGRQVWIDHGRGIVTRYAHLSAVAQLSVGERVTAGEVIGAVGSSGYPQGGPHLHLEVRVGDDYFGDGLSGDALVRAISRLFRS